MDSKQAATLAAFLLDERRVEDDTWHQLSTGVLTREEVVALRSRFESPEELERKLALFGPTPTERSEEVLTILLQRYFAGPGESGAEGSSPASASNPSNVDESSPAAVVPLREASRGRGRRGWTLVTSGSLAAAATLLLVWAVRPPDRPTNDVGLASVPDAPPLPRFDLVFHGGGSIDVRGADGGPAPAWCDERYRHDQSVVVRLHPGVEIVEDLEAALSVRPADEDSPAHERWPALSSTANDVGVITIDQPLAELGLTPGTWTLTFYVIRKPTAESPPLDRATLRALDPGVHPGVTVVRGNVCVDE